jgi:hypothetical protein
MENAGGWAAAAAVALALAGIAAYVLFPGARRSPSGRLFRRLAEENGLTPAEAKLLRRLADRAQPDHPAMIFVRRSLFESAASEERVPPALLSELRRKLYAP